MDSLFTVVDTAGRARYEGSSLREGYDIWKIVVHATYIHTDKDCGGGTTLDFADEGGYERLMDSSCGRMSCDDCNPDDVDTPIYDPETDMCQGCMGVERRHHMPSDGHAFVGSDNSNF